MPDNPIQELARATEKHLARNRSTLDWFYAKRFWLIVAILVTLFIPVLENRVHHNIPLNRSGEPALTGFDVLNPTMALWQNGNVVGASWCVNPFAAALYLPAAVLAYLSFVRKPMKPKLEITLTGIMAACAVTLPLTHLPVCDMMIPALWCRWMVQPVLWGWFVVALASAALFFATWAQQVPPDNSEATTAKSV